MGPGTAAARRGGRGSARGGGSLRGCFAFAAAAGDVVTAIDGNRITGSGELVAAIADHKPGDQLEVTVRRGSDTRIVTVTLGTQPTTQSSSSVG